MADLQVLEDRKKALNSQLTGLNKDLKKVSSRVSIYALQIGTYEDYKDIFEDMLPIEEIGKPITDKEIRDIWFESTGEDLKDLYELGDKSTKVCFTTPAYRKYRLPLDVVHTILSRSATNFDLHTSSNAAQQIVADGGYLQKYVCNDFAGRLWGEMWKGPYWESMFGLLGVRGHRINAFIPAEIDKVHYIEPQNDRVWIPNKEAILEAKKKREEWTAESGGKKPRSHKDNPFNIFL